MLLLLEVATLQGGIEIADVKPDLHAKATEAFAECARNAALRRTLGPAQAATPERESRSRTSSRRGEAGRADPAGRRNDFRR
ncbi:MAG: hypothetical protein E6J85_17730 [Deltaproteobacteria bacterium]|nr:MAG: hypothetical protein E6J85_17730 [Deltaproteobacteria bacterium]TMB35030.1 MAG: hypothetical protein E6J61_02255 [Deltaproteobacteria bacterium]